jgi:hypothetical protein
MATDQTRERKATIARAIAHIYSTDTELVRAQLGTTNLYDRFKADPDALADSLAVALRGEKPPATPTGRLFGAWKAAQQLLQAAGLPYGAPRKESRTHGGTWPCGRKTHPSNDPSGDPTDTGHYWQSVENRGTDIDYWCPGDEH